MQATKPAKEIVRQYMQQRVECARQHSSAPPTLEVIRRELGWGLIRDVVNGRE